MKQISDNITYYESYDEIKSDGFSPVQCKSVLQFFMLKGRTVIINRDNIIPIPDLSFVVKAKTPERYYLKKFREYGLDELYFYRKTLTFSGEDVPVENLRCFVEDANVWLLFKAEQSVLISDMLSRVYKGYFKKEGKVPYPVFIQLMRYSLDLEDYIDYGKAFTGYKTVCNQYSDRINELWKGIMPK